MKYSRLFLILFSSIILISINAQENLHLHVAGGLVSPFNSKRGGSILGKAQYHIDKQFSLYFQSGYLYYGEYYLNYEIDHERKRIADELNHEVIPILLGGRYTAVNESSWYPFIEVELGVSIYNFQKGDIIPRYHHETGELVQFDRVNLREENKVLASYGVGFGITHPITQNLGTEIGLKLNSNIDEQYSILLGGRGTYTTIYWGFVFYFI